MTDINTKDVTIIIRGPLSDNAIDKISESINKSGYHFGDIIVSTYNYEVDKYRNLLHSFANLTEARFSVVKDRINPGFFNVNRQIYAAASALNLVTTKYVIMLRNDQYVDFHKVIHFLSDVPCSKYLTVNTFTRRDRLYHPSDMFVAGGVDLIRVLFSMPLMPETHMQILRREQRFVAADRNYRALSNAPEQLIFKNFLKCMGWNIKDTVLDSESALRKYVYLCNSWDIDLRWNKPRTYLMGRGAIILPHYFKIKPFPEGPLERVRCWNRHQLDKTALTLKDWYFIVLSRLVWAFWPYNESRTGRFVRRIRKILGNL